jgi:hypothetical protein
MNADKSIEPASAGPPNSNSDRVVLVLGTNRSGTTWLHRLLLAHRDIAGVETETLLLQSLAGLWHTALTGDSGTGPLLPVTELAEYSRNFCDELITSALRASGRPAARYFAEKTASTALHLPWVKLVFPDAWYIRIVRDGRDVARSMRLRDYGSCSDLFNIQCWARHENMADAYLRGVHRVIDVRYEALFADPLTEMLRIYGALGLSHYDGLVRDVARRSRTAVARYNREASVGTGKWRSDVSRRRLGLMYASAGMDLRQRGYLSAGELQYWQRRPEYWLGLARRSLLRAGLGSRTAVWLFSPGQGVRAVPDSDLVALEEWAKLERPYMKDPRAVRNARRAAGAPPTDKRGTR